MANKEDKLRQELMGEVAGATFNDNLLIEAGAGAGKTYTMTNRIINQLLEGKCKPEELVAITFTEKATQEMLGRIDSRLRELISINPNREDLKKLLNDIDKMQISTIHSFCQKLLSLMPFYSDIGPGFTVMDDAETVRYASRFFYKKISESAEETKINEISKITGYKVSAIKEKFLQYSKEMGDLVFDSVDFLQECKKIVDDIRSGNGKWQIKYLVYSNSRQEFKDAFEWAKWAKQQKGYYNTKDKTKTYLEVFQDVTGINLTPLKTYDPDKLFDELYAKYHNDTNVFLKTIASGDEYGLYAFMQECGADGVKNHGFSKNQQNDKDKIASVSEKWLNYIHYCVGSLIAEYITEYRNQKLEDKRISQGDLLFYACKMLRESQEARVYFHDRYKTIYVDEMQDTNPVQAQLLFYLTTSKDKFDDSDWTKCEPEAGRLFLVGDPKQAIYRFCGADIAVYNKLKNHPIFKNNTKKLTYNYRSTTEICEYVNATFKELLKRDAERAETSEKYQAEYTETLSQSGKSALPMSVVIYGNGIEDSKQDAEKVVDFIKDMVDKKVMVGPKSKKHVVQYKDFLILTYAKDDTASYALALANANIPCNLTGKKDFKSSLVISRGVNLLNFLLETGDETRLVTVLDKCYGISLHDIAAFKMLTGNVSLNKLDKIKVTFKNEDKNGNKFKDSFKSILAALDELNTLKGMIYKYSGITVLEYIFDRSYACWRTQKPETQVSDYAMTRQFLNSLKEEGYCSFVELVDKALKLADGATERELLMEEDVDCVRVMNLHKAKGLEAEIIILGYSCPSEKAVINHISYDNNEIKIYSKWGKNGGCVKNWSKHEGEEKNFLAAERTRLLYVAATRPKSMLFICAAGAKKCYWEKLFDPTNAIEEDMLIPNTDLAKEKLATEEDFNKWIMSLPKPKKAKVDKKDRCDKSVDVVKINKALEKKNTDITNKANSFSISPSKLDHGTRSVVATDSDNKVYNPEDNESQYTVSCNAQDEAENNEKKVTDKSPYDEMVSDAEFIPYGSDWGTIVHRVMELLVIDNSFDKISIQNFAVQAILETIDSKVMTKDQEKKLLNGNSNLDPLVFISGKVYDYLHSASIDSEDGVLRRFIADADSLYPELPFTLFEENGKSRFAGTVYNAVKNAPKERVSLDMEGIMDLVVVKGGKFYIIDYKTDKLAYITKKDRKENEDEYKARLIDEYTNQLKCYMEILEKAGKTVASVYICALTLKGELIEIPSK